MTNIPTPPAVLFKKAPNGVVQVSWNWANWLPQGGTIAGTPTVQVTNSSAEIAFSGLDPTATIVYAQLSGGAIGDMAECTCTITDSLGEVWTDGFLVPIQSY